MEKTSISSIGNLDMIELKPDQTVMSCELGDAESFYRFWQGLAYERIMIQVITGGVIYRRPVRVFQRLCLQSDEAGEKAISFPMRST